ncbi:MAG: recombinase family protein, partial [Flavobacteriales bacterium]|nr:recombinase family protein [Flavobacteriales bacterium]
MKKCLIYTRVSTVEQTRGEFTSIDNQERICLHAIALKEEENWQHVQTISDPGFSGKDLNRPGISKAISDIKAGLYDVIVTYKVDRVSRSLVKFYEFYNLLQEKGIAFYSATQNFDTSSSAGKLMLNMLLSFAEYEREIVMERTRDRLQANFERGKWGGGWVPFGYNYNLENGILVPNPDEKAVVDMIFGLLSKGYALKKVADHLNESGYRTKIRNQTRKDGGTRIVGGNYFTSDTVSTIAKNPIYTGKIRHNNEIGDGQHEAIVTEQLFNNVNLKLNGKVNGELSNFYERDEHVHLLKGLIRCGDCGSLMTPFPSGKKDKHGNPYLYYTCTDVVHHKRRSTCKLRTLSARPFEKTIKEFLKCLGDNKVILEGCIAEANKGKGKGLTRIRSKVKKLEKQVTELTRGIKAFSDFLKSGEPIPDDLRADYRKQVEEREETKLVLEKLNVELGFREREKMDSTLIQESLRLFDKVIDSLPLKDQKELMQLLIKEIRVSLVNPDNNKTPSEEGAFISKLRTKHIQVNVILHELPSLPITYDNGEQKFVIQSKWLPEQ